MMSDKKRILITGGAGFIGSHLAEDLVKNGYYVKILGTFNILDSALENNIEPVVYASTSEVYGSAKYVPMDEDHPLNPASPYAASKAAADRLCFSYYNTYKLPVVIVRCFNTYGPRQKATGS